MTARAPRPCAHPGCPVLTPARYCQAHGPKPRMCAVMGCPRTARAGESVCDEHARDRDRERGSAHARGYDRDWQVVRLAYLQTHPLCEDCEARGCIVPAALVHHKQAIRAGGDRLSEGNLRALCVDCHAKAHGGRYSGGRGA